MAAKTQLKILEISHNKTLIIAQSAKEEVSERSEEELVDMTEDMQYNKGCLQRMAQALMAHENMWKAMEATEKSSSKLIKLQQGTDRIHSCSEVGSITGAFQGGLRQASKSPGNLYRSLVGQGEHGGGGGGHGTAGLRAMMGNNPRVNPPLAV
jgi:hypothetical protein